MNEHFYRHLLQETAAHLRLGDPGRLLETGLLKVDGLPVLLMYDEAFDPDLLQIRFDLGARPLEGREGLLEALLESNFIWGQGGRFVFGITAGDPHVILTMQHEISMNLTAPELSDWLRAAAREVKTRWKEILELTAQEADQEPSRGEPKRVLARMPLASPG